MVLLLVFDLSVPWISTYRRFNCTKVSGVVWFAQSLGSKLQLFKCVLEHITM